MAKSLLPTFNLEDWHERSRSPIQKVREEAADIRWQLGHSDHIDDIVASIDLLMGYYWREAECPVPLDEYAPSWLYANGYLFQPRGIRVLKKKHPVFGRPRIEFGRHEWDSFGRHEYIHDRGVAFGVNHWKRMPSYR